MKKWIEYSILVAVLLPLFFINIKSSHDWGDDFAQYIHQAKNITEGISQNETGYIYNEHYAIIGPQSYPVGFPLILSIVFKCLNEDIITLNYVMTFFLCLSAFIGFVIIRNFNSFLSSLLLVVIVVYNPYFLNFKTEILSDLPFTILSLLSVYMIDKENDWKQSMLLGVLMAFSIHIRSIGFAVVLSYIIYHLFTNKLFFKNKLFLLTFGFTVITFITLKITYNCNSYYPFNFNPIDVWFNGNTNISCNIGELTKFFVMKTPIDNPYSYIGIISSSALLIFSILGFLIQLKTNFKSPFVIYFSVYLFVLFVFPFANTDFRFIIPVLFIITLFLTVGLKAAVTSLTNKRIYIAAVGSVFILWSYYLPISVILNNQNKTIEGPQTDYAKETFSYIKTNIDTSSIISYTKPRALALYANCKSIAINPEASYSEFRKEIKQFGVNYILINQLDYSNSEEIYFAQDTTNCQSVFNNKQFTLYKIKQTNF